MFATRSPLSRQRIPQCVRALILSGMALLNAPALQLPARADTEPAKAQQYIIPPALKDLGRNYKVRLVYFVPTDKEIKPQYREKIEVLMRVVADVYRRDLTNKGHNTRGLDFEFDNKGQLKVHLLRGKHPAKHYTGDPPTSDRLFQSTSAEMIGTIGYPLRRACLIFSEAGGIAEATPAHPYCGVAMVSGDMLRDKITAPTIEKHIRNMFDETPVKNADGKDGEHRNREIQISNGVLLHELGHIFYMLHDQRDQRCIMAYGYHNLRLLFQKQQANKQPVHFSPAHARMAAGTRYFSESFNEQDTTVPQVKFQFARPPQPGDKEIHFSLKAMDNEGLHAVIYYESTLDSLVDGEKLEGKQTDKKGVLNRRVPIRPGQLVHYRIYLMDVNGNVGTAELSHRVSAEK